MSAKPMIALREQNVLLPMLRYDFLLLWSPCFRLQAYLHTYEWGGFCWHRQRDDEPRKDHRQYRFPNRPRTSVTHP